MKRDEPASPSVDLEAIQRQHRFDTWWDRLGELTTSATDNRSVVASEICDLEAEVARLQAQVDAMREVVEAAKETFRLHTCFAIRDRRPTGFEDALARLQ